MARRRYISTDISLDERINQLAAEAGDFAVLLYTWMIPHASDDATIRGTPWRVMQMVVPGRRDKTEDDIGLALAAMDQVGLIRWDMSEQVIYFPAEAFYRYQPYVKQSQRRSESSADAPSPSIEVAEISGDQRESAENSVSFSPSFSSPVPVSPSVSVPPSPRDDEGGAAAPDTADEIAEILIQAPWINDEQDEVAKQVRRSFALVKDFNARDGPALAELFVRWKGYVKKPPSNWFSTWLQWLRKEVRDEHKPGANGSAASAGSGVGNVESDVARRGYSYNAATQRQGA